MFYGQFGEDQYLSKFFDDKYIGVCVDVGADDGISGSNTYYFEQKGWYSLCVEPIPESFNKCSSIRKNVINCCIADYDKEDVKFNIITLKTGNTSAISSLKVDDRLIKSHKHLLNNIKQISVKVKTLNTIFKECNIPNNIDFISIDTENTEIDVLKGLDFNTYNIKFLIIENNFNEMIIENYLITKNFKKIHRLGVNDFYVNISCFRFTINDNLKIMDTNVNKYINSKNLIEVSVGEIVDKYSILELKNKYITDTNKLHEIKKEMSILEENVSIKNKNTYFYKLLLHINEEIWLDTDKIKQINVKLIECYKDYIELSNTIFENNQRRFRLKNYFNIIESSNIKECKSYQDDTCFIIINNEDEIYDKIPEINYLCINHDVIYFKNDYKNIITKLFKNLNILFINDIDSKSDNILISYDLSNYSLTPDKREIYEFETITYKSGGKFGDFLNQLSVICEKFYNTGKKGELYIYDLCGEGDKFAFGIENTYNDTYDFIISQKYIKKYKIYNNEQVEIDLSSWRNNLNLNCKLENQLNWYNIYNNKYNIEWGNHKWINTDNIDLKWKNKIIINSTPYRQLSRDAIVKIKEQIKDDLDSCVFISNEIEHYNNFSNITGIKIDFYKPKNFDETVVIINSCKYGIFCFSSQAVIANGLHKTHYLMGRLNIEYKFNNITNYAPHLLDIFI
jgi:FkbM family methyltransferase